MYSGELALAGSQNIKEKEFWLNQLAGDLVKSSFPFDFDKGEQAGTSNGSVNIKLLKKVGSGLMKLCKGSDYALYMILTAGLLVLINKYTNHRDILIGAPIYKQDIEAEFINTILVLRNRLEEDMTFKQLLLQVKETIFAATENYSYPIELLPQSLDLPVSDRNFPLFDIVILLENIHDRKYIRHIHTNMKFFLTRVEEEVKGVVEFNTLLYENATIVRIVSHLENILERVLVNPDLPIADIDILSNREKEQLLFEVNNKGTHFPKDKTIPRLVEEQVEKHADRTAIVFGEQHLTYNEINKKANRLARMLRKRGVTADTIVGIMLERSLEMMVAIIGIIKSGGAYLPLEPESPGMRVIAMLEDCQVSIILTHSSMITRYSFSGLQGLSTGKGTPHVTAGRPPIVDFDSLPIPDRSLANYEEYVKYIGQGMVKNSITLQLTRGCAYNCAYCCRVWPRKHVCRSAEHIIEEVQLYYNMGFRRFVIIDDIFNLNIKNSRRFFELIIRKGLDVQLGFPSGLRGDILTEDYIDLMVKAGTISFPLALETASPRLQKLIAKHLNLEKLRNNIQYILDKYPQVILELHTMHGFPSETEEEAMMTLDFIKSLKLIHFPYIHILKIYTNTEMVNIALAHGISAEAISISQDRAYHELPETLPFSKSFTLSYQSDFLNTYFLSRERLLKVLPYQMKVLTEDEIVQKYNAYLAVEIKSFADLLQFIGISREELGGQEFPDEQDFVVADVNEKMRACFPGRTPDQDALRVLLLDLSQLFAAESTELYEVVEQPLGIMYVMTYLKKQFGSKVNGKIAKSRIDFGNYAELKVLLEQFKPEVIGIRTLTIYKNFFHKTAAMIRHWGIDVPIIAGGPYATVDYATLLQDKNIDLAVLGEGELTFARVIEKIMENARQLPGEEVLEEIKGIAFVPPQASSYRNFGREIVMLDVGGKLLSRESAENPELINQSGNLAYTMFTSGSTGKPKGILTRHDNVIRVVRDTNYIDLTENDRILQLSNYAFDGSVFDIYGALLNGAALVTMKQEDVFSMDNLSNLISREAITVFFVTTALFNAIVDMRINCLDKIRKVLFGGEKVSLEHSGKALEYLGKDKIIHVYGPTETTVFATYYFINEIDPRRSTIPIGKPLANTKVYVVDKNFKPVSPGVVGEAYIGGDGLASGYLNNMILTSEKFAANPFVEGEYLYKSGDLMRWSADMNLEFIGRVDQQVKVRGFRIELGEIENQLLKHEHITGAIVVVNEDKVGDKYLGAYFISDIKFSAAELREYLSKYMPDYMIPSYFMQIEKILLTPNGKLDRKALPPFKIEVGDEYSAPRNDTERKLVSIWAEVLNVDKEVIGIDSNFFELGGHSLKATILISMIHKGLNVKMPLSELFRIQTVRGLAEYIHHAGEDQYTIIKPVEKREYYPLSSAQKRLCFLQQLDLESTSYNIPQVFSLGKDIDKIKMESILKKLIARHESLRTSIELVEEEPVQRVHANVAFKIEYYDLATEATGSTGITRELDPLSPEPAVLSTQPAAVPISSFIRSFDLSRAPLIRSIIIKLADNNHIWMVDMHHIISDGTSLTVLTEDFIALYSGEELPGIRIQYKDFSQWQNHLFESGRIKVQEDYWLELYSGGVPQLELPADCKRPEVFTFEGDKYSFKLEREEAVEFRSLGFRHGGTLYMNILTALNTLFYIYTGQTDIAIGCGIAGRRHADLQGIIGMFVNTLAMRNYPQGEKTYESLLKEVIAHSVKAFENQDLQFEELVDKLVLERDASRNPLFDIMMSVQNFRRAGEGVIIDQNAWQWEQLPAPTENLPSIDDKNTTSKFDMTFFVYEEEEDVFVDIQYYTAIFKRETIARLARHFKKVVKESAANPTIQLKAIDILSQQEKQQLLFQFNDTKTLYPREKTIGELFEEQVEKAPHHTAVVLGQERLTYKALDERSNQVANYLYCANGVVPGQPVGILMDRAISMIIVIVGILKAGGAYVPISPSFPGERIKTMAEDSGMKVLIGQKRYIKTLNRVQWECGDLDTFLCIDSEDVHCEDEVEENELMNRKLWEYVGETAVDEVTGGGWNSSYTGSPIPKEEMDEYGDNILKKLEPLLHKDVRVLEIGAASGITMYRIAPRVGLYYGTDLSGIIIEKNKDRVKKEGHKNIKFHRLAAHEIQRLDERDFDLVILNSVIQCFNGHNYLRKVIRKAIHLMKSSGYIFIGDIMDQESKEDLIADLVRFKQANRGMNYKTKVNWSEELFISRRFWEDLALDVPGIHAMEFSYKIYTLENELTKFRYDALLYIEKTKAGKKRKKRNQRHKNQHDLRTLSKYPTARLTPGPHSGNLAYIIYTSGSTGKPKGNLTTHYNVTRVVKNTNYIEFQPGDKVLQLSDYAFDGSVFDIYGALLNGSTLVMVKREQVLEIETLCELIKREKISVFFVTTALFNTLVDVGLEGLSNTRKILFGGERVSVKHTAKALRYLGRDRMLHVYGPTETTVYATYYKINEVNDNQITIPIGSPISNTTAYILDPYSRLVPLGVYGEIYIGGPGVCKGYLNDEALTKEKFVPNPFIEGEMLYRTGDLGRWLADGNIEFMGRIDQQVKLRGFRIELGEIESCLLTHDTIKEALVAAKDDENGSKYLCAYIVCTGETASETKLDTTELREYLSLTLPDYMIPSYFVQMEKIPLTPNGKVDHKALPEPELGLSPQGYVPPGNEVEEKLAATWQEVLGVRRIGINDNFFQVGGDSIKAIQVSARLKKYGLEIKISDLFLHPTIKELGKCVTEQQRVIYQGIASGQVELTPIQRWFFQSDFTNSHHFNQAVMLCRNNFDEAALKKVFTKIVEHHDALRMVYEVRENEIIQVNRGIDGKLFDFEVFDFRDEIDGDINIEKRIETEAQRIQGEIDLERGPLVKTALFKTPTRDHLLIVIHHLVVDGVSWRILLEDIGSSFQQLERGGEIRFPAKTDSFKDWSAQLNLYAQSKKLLKELEYWKKLEDKKIPAISKDREIPGEKKKVKYLRDITLNLDEEKTGLLLKKVNHAYNTEINDILLAALAMAIHDWQGQENVLINLEGHGREGIIEGLDITRTVGWFTSQYPVLLKVEKAKELSQQIKTVKETLRQIPVKGIGYGILRYLTPMEKKKGKDFQLEPEISFNYLGQFGQERYPGFFEVSPLKPGLVVSPELHQVYAIEINGMILEGKLNITFRFNCYEYEQQNIQQLVSSYKSNLIKIIHHCSHKKEKELTPSDVGCKNLSIENLRKIEKYTAAQVGKHLEIVQIYPLTPMQGGMLYHSLRSNVSGTYIDQIVFTFKGVIDRSLLEDSFNRLISRHDIFRTVFVYEGLESPLQIVLKERRTKIEYTDITHLSKDEQALHIEKFKSKIRKKGFDAAKDILITISLFKTSENTWKLVWSFHHILMDGWCMGIIFKELTRQYLSLKQGKPVELEPVTPYGKYIQWLEDQDKQEGLRYWQTYLEEYRQLAGFRQKNQSPGNNHQYKLEEYRVVFNEVLTANLNEIAAKNQVTLNSVFQVLWAVLLQEYNNTDDVVFGAVVSGRTPEVPGIENMVGLFINTLPVRIRKKEGQTFSQLIRDVQKRAIVSKSYEYVPLPEIQSNCLLKRNLFDHILALQNYPLREAIEETGSEEETGFTMEKMEAEDQTNYNLNIIVGPAKCLLVKFNYNSFVYEGDFIRSLASHFEEITGKVTENPEILLDDIEMVSEEEKVKILLESNLNKKGENYDF
jgi:amino acid adenylation domain-containing protein/non-ribosomal peptide synthase protein (TIGR01720 family)